MPADPPSPAIPALKSADQKQAESAPPGSEPAIDADLRRMLKWVFGALILTVLFAIVAVEITLRWFEP